MHLSPLPSLVRHTQTAPPTSIFSSRLFRKLYLPHTHTFLFIAHFFVGFGFRFVVYLAKPYCCKTYLRVCVFRFLRSCSCVRARYGPILLIHSSAALR